MRTSSGGLTIIVMGGVGKSVPDSSALGLFPAGWFLQVWSSFDFEWLIWLESEWQR
jgi:hypothetical protein